MNRREVIVIILLVAAALCVPAAILSGGLRDAAERDWRNRPYEGSAEAFRQEHMALLDEAAEILWRRRAHYEGLLGEWDSEWQLSRSEFGGECRAPFTPAEWAVLQRAFGEQMCVMVSLSWWHEPHLEFIVDTTADGRVRLLFSPAETRDAAAFARLIGDMQGIGAAMQATADPDWFSSR